MKQLWRFVSTFLILFLLSRFQKPGNPMATLTGILCLLMSMFGVFLLAYGTMIVILTIIATIAGKDATGLGIIVGPLIGLPELLLCILFPPAIRLLNLNKKTVVLLMIIPVLAVIFLRTQSNFKRTAFDKLDQDFDIYNPTTEMIQSMKERITNEFRKHETLFLTVRYYPPKSGPFATGQRSLENYYIEAIGRENIRRFKWGPKNNWFAVELDETGYENLRKAQYLRSIYFYDIAIYGKLPRFPGGTNNSEDTY